MALTRVKAGETSPEKRAGGPRSSAGSVPGGTPERKPESPEKASPSMALVVLPKPKQAAEKWKPAAVWGVGRMKETREAYNEMEREDAQEKKIEEAVKKEDEAAGSNPGAGGLLGKLAGLGGGGGSKWKLLGGGGGLAGRRSNSPERDKQS